MEILSIFIIGIGLSMDAFSLALCYGVLDLSKTKRKTVAFVVGGFHFFMPLFGMVLGNFLEHMIIIDMRFVVFSIFMILGLEMVSSAINKETNIILLNGIGILLFAFTVSVDSFSAGIGIKFISNNYFLCSTLFSLNSFFFTYLGLLIGGVIGSKYGETSKLVGGIILGLFALIYLFR